MAGIRGRVASGVSESHSSCIFLRLLGEVCRAGRLSQTSVFASALTQSAQKTGKAIGQAAMDPVGTVAGIPAGVGRLFQPTARTIEHTTESSGTSSQQASTKSSTQDLIGVNKAERQIAKQVGADPYTTNPVLAKQLDDLAWAAYAGGVSLDVALAVSTAGVATAISATATVSNLVWDKSPEDIRNINEGKFARMGVAPDGIRAFVTNRWLTPTIAAPFGDNHAQLPAGKGRAGLVALAGGVASESEARYLLNVAAMLRRLGTTTDPIVAIDLTRRIVVASAIRKCTNVARSDKKARIDTKALQPHSRQV